MKTLTISRTPENLGIDIADLYTIIDDDGCAKYVENISEVDLSEIDSVDFDHGIAQLRNTEDYVNSTLEMAKSINEEIFIILKKKADRIFSGKLTKIGESLVNTDNATDEDYVEASEFEQNMKLIDNQQFSGLN